MLNLETLAGVGETTITPDVLRKAGVVKGKNRIKVLGDAALKSALTVQAHKFFFSSRRRHTRSKRDWSSDVCSSDLLLNLTVMAMAALQHRSGTRHILAEIRTI